MSYDLDLFVSLDALPKPIYITWPDGSLKTVTLGGNVQLDDNITLRKVLYVPEFKFNLLSVTKLLADQNLCIHLYPTECIFQDLTTHQVVAVAPEHNGLYKLESQVSSKHTKKGRLGRRNSQGHPTDLANQNMSIATPNQSTIANKACSQLPLEILHARLGHTSVSKMKYISACKDVIADNFFCEICILAKAH